MPLSLAKYFAGQAVAARNCLLRQTRQYGSSTTTSSSQYQSTTIMLPLMKLGTLAIRTISKPIAARLKSHAAVHPRFCAAIIWMAQTKYRWATQLQRRMQYGRAVNVVIRPLDEAKAIAAATDFLGELVIFTVAGALIMYEVNRSYKSEAKKEAQRKKDLEVFYSVNLNLAIYTARGMIGGDSDPLLTEIFLHLPNKCILAINSHPKALKLKDNDLQKEVESLRLKLQEMERQLQLQSRTSWLDFLKIFVFRRQAAQEQKPA